MIYLFFAVGFIFLIKGADLLVDGASSVARRLRISTLVIGLTIVSFGTSAPELVVNIIASIQGSGGIALGNILGSNISNILLILGIASIIYPLSLKKSTVWKEIPLSLLAILAVGFMVNDGLLEGASSSILSRIDGLILFLFFVIFIYYTFGIGRVTGEAGERVKEYNLFKSIVLIVVGIIGLTLGGKWIVDGAIFIASKLDISESLIALTIIAVGTSLPELATSVVAALKKKEDIAVGNVVGSNIFNLLFVLGLSSVIRPINFSLVLNFDIIVVILATFLLFMFMFFGEKHKLQKVQGVIFVMLYISYIFYLVLRG